MKVKKLHNEWDFMKSHHTQLPPPCDILQIETDMHPYFKRVWNIRHVLTETSPILTAKARRMIEENDGFWPEMWNDYEAVRDHIRFNDIIVSFSGTANVSGSSVYAQKVYDYANINIGYSFANVLSILKGQVVVDAELLNDITEQTGGGAEPFHSGEDDDRNIIDDAVKTTKAAYDAVVDSAQIAAGISKAATEGAAENTKVAFGVVKAGAQTVVGATMAATEGAVQANKSAYEAVKAGTKTAVDATKAATEDALSSTKAAYDATTLAGAKMRSFSGYGSNSNAGPTNTNTAGGKNDETADKMEDCTSNCYY